MLSVFLEDQDGGSPTEPRYAQPVLEQVELTVREGREAAFEQAAPIIQIWRSLLHHFYEDVPPVDHWRDLHRS